MKEIVYVADIGQVQIDDDAPYHLCPVCGKESVTSSRVCPWHYPITVVRVQELEAQQ